MNELLPFAATDINLILVGIASFVAGSALTTVIAAAWLRRTARAHRHTIALGYSERGSIVGIWRQDIPTEGKEDGVHCWRDGEFVHGTINRRKGHLTSYTWDFLGRYEGPSVFCVYWPTNPGPEQGSYGSIQLMRGQDDDQWLGSYVKMMSVVDGKERVVNQLTRVDLTWTLEQREPGPPPE